MNTLDTLVNMEGLKIEGLMYAERDSFFNARNAETTSDLATLLEEIETRCTAQTREIKKWLAYTERFKRTIIQTLEQMETTITVQTPRPRRSHSSPLSAGSATPK
ncbi:unnamed protein product [Penicillium bialowiezense]